MLFEKPWQFKSLMMGNHSNASLLHWWRHLKGLPNYQYHIQLQCASDDELMKTIPCCIYGDGAEMFRDDEFWVMNWTSVFSSGGGHERLMNRYPIIIVAERQMQSDQDPRQQNIVFLFLLNSIVGMFCPFIESHP